VFDEGNFDEVGFDDPAAYPLRVPVALEAILLAGDPSDPFGVDPGATAFALPGPGPCGVDPAFTALLSSSGPSDPFGVDPSRTAAL
jgi:hypothetical protein